MTRYQQLQAREKQGLDRATVLPFGHCCGVDEGIEVRRSPKHRSGDAREKISLMKDLKKLGWQPASTFPPFGLRLPALRNQQTRCRGSLMPLYRLSDDRLS